MKISNLSILFFFTLILSISLSSCKSDSSKTTATTTPAKKIAKAATKKTQLKKKNKQGKKLPNFKQLNRLKTSTSYTIGKINKQSVNKSTPLEIKDKFVVVSGWAYDKVANKPAGAVYLEIGNKIFPAKYGSEKPGLVKKNNNPDLLKSGYTAKVPVAKIGEGVHSVNLRVLSNDEKSYFPPIKQKAVKIKI